MTRFAHDVSIKFLEKIFIFNDLTSVRFACETFTGLRELRGNRTVMKGSAHGQA